MSNINKLAVFFKKEVGKVINKKGYKYKSTKIIFTNYKQEDADKLKEIFINELDKEEILYIDVRNCSYRSGVYSFMLNISTDDTKRFNNYWKTFKTYWKTVRNITRKVKNCSCIDCSLACECDCHTEYRRLWLLHNPFYVSEKSKDRLDKEKDFPNIIIAGDKLSKDLDNKICNICNSNIRTPELSAVMDKYKNTSLRWFEYVYVNDILSLGDKDFTEEYTKYKSRLDLIEKYRNEIMDCLEAKTYKYTYKFRGFSSEFRGFSPECQPLNDLKNVYKDDNYRFEIIEYSRKLTEKEIQEYQLIDLN